jgi:hypothetical protein
MKKCMVVTNAIDVDYSKPLTYSSVRSAFSSDERLAQTIETIKTINRYCDEDTKIYFLVLADQPEKYCKEFAADNLVYVDYIKKFPKEYDIIRTHPNKTHCEVIMQKTFFESYAEELKQYDYFFKLSGRYLLDDTFNLELCNNDNLNKFLFKPHHEFEWQDWWGMDLIDRRKYQNNNNIHQYCTILYGWGREKHSIMINILKVIADVTGYNKTMQYDLELLTYFFTRWYEDDIVDLPATVSGWVGVNGQFVRY